MKKFLLSILLFLIAGSSWAITVQVGTGTTTTSNLPIYSCYGYTYSQQIYTQAQIATDGDITKIRFFYTSGTYNTSVDWVVYLGHTTKTSFTTTTDWVPLASLTQVFSGVVTYPAIGNWMEITLTTPFTYNNVDNLVVAVDENTAGYYCSIFWRSFTSGSNTGIYYRSDGTNPNPASPPTASGRTGTLAQIQLDMDQGGCTGTPAPGNTMASSVQVLAGVYFTLSLENQTAGSGVTYQWQSSPTGADPWTNIGTNSNTHIASQTEDTYYRCQVTCSGNTGNSNPVLVYMCSDNMTYPFFESFDGTVFPPSCWDTSLILIGSGSGTQYGNWDRVTTGTSPTCSPHSGAGMVRFNSFSFKGGTKSILVSQPLNIPTDYYLVKFWMFRDNGYATLYDLVNIYYNTSPTTSGATLLGTVNRYFMFSPAEATANAWYSYEFGLPSGSGGGGGRYVIFEGVSAYGNNIFVDDIGITSPSSLYGNVFDYNGNPLEGATVQKVGGISDITGPGGDYNLIPLAEGSQQFKCSKTGYNDVLVTIDIPANTMVNYNFTLLQPQMDVAPESIFVILGSSETSSHNLVITNNGNGMLDWNAAAMSIESCEYTIDLVDSYGDGWNGGKVDVLVNGVVVLNDLTIIDGYGPESHTFAVSGGDEITTLWTAGLYPGENRYYIYDNLGTLVWFAQGTSGPPNILPGQLFGACSISWLSLNVTNGQVDPFGGTGNVVATIDAGATPPVDAPGVTYNAEILFTSPAGIPPVSVPVTLVVTDGSLKGPQDLEIFSINEAEGIFMLKWKYFTIRELQFDHFVILRNGEMFATSTASMLEIVLSEPGTFCFQVYAVYNNGAYSEPSNELCITYPFAPGVPISNWALVLAGLLIGTYAFIMIRKRS